DDDEATRRQLQRLLESDDRFRLRVDTVADGKKALQALVENHYSIIITDLKMPGLDGMDLIAEVQKRGLAVTVIVTTGFGGIDEAVQAMRLGAYDFLDRKSTR